ncbi:hypothetical protein L7F22_027682 [Adiantum nelumboides]|nr:hypothetical protein [Adiantum nelumboides]
MLTENDDVFYDAQETLSLQSTMPAELLVSGEVSHTWILDSGASLHVTPHRHWFTTYEETIGTVTLGDSYSCDIVGIGDIAMVMANGVNLPSIIYQREFLVKAREGNIIVCLETGCGKTLIAAMLLKELSCNFSSLAPHIAVFLVPTVMLVQQQARAIENFTDLKVGQYNGQSNSMRWDLEKWKYDVYNLEVLVMTPQSLLNVLQHAMLMFEAIKVLVFDECHHCQKNHPYALIMENFYFKLQICRRPRILGLTASPVIRKGKSEFQCTQDIHSLERMLDAKIVTVEDRTELDFIVPSPNIQVKEYNKVYHSLDRLQSVMKTLNIQKAKNNEEQGLGKICRDLEYCIYDLGLWFARQVASDSYIFSKEIYDSTTNTEKDSLLRDVYECLDQTIIEGGYGDPVAFDSLRPDLVSNKVASLVDVLATFRYSQLKCIVFVERVVAAKVLAPFLSEIFKPLRCEHIVGQHLKMGTSSRNRMSKTLSDFRSGLVDCLVATNVAEEGLDIQDCCLIVQFDIPKTLRSFIQSRGRARVRSSHYVILKDRMSISEDELIDSLINNEKFVTKTILQGNDKLIESKSREEGDVYEVKSTGALVTSHSSIQLLYHYCSKLPSDQFYHPQPLFVYVKEQEGVKSFLTLPSNASVRMVEGELCESENAAKRAVCLKACRILHLKGALTDHLLPLTSSKEENAGDLSNRQNSEAAMEELQEPVIPEVWRHSPPISFDVIVLHAYKISFNSVVRDREYSNFALLMKSYLPQEAANLAETFQLRQGRAVFCKLEALKDVCLNPVQIAQAEQFQSALFSVLLDRNLELSQSKDQLAYGPWYLLLPLKKDQPVTFSEDQDIDWERISKLKSFGGLNNVINAAETPGLKDDGTPLQFFNGVLNKENVPGLLVRTIYNQTLYCIIEIFKDLHAESPFPNGQYKSYVDYYRSMYKCELLLRGQHFLKARFLRDAHNFLLNRSKKQGVTDLPSIRNSNDEIEHSFEARKPIEDTDRSIVELPPEICSIVCCGFYDDLVNAAVILPSVMHQIESILVANQFHMLLSSKFAEGSLVSVKKVLEATTTQKCLSCFSLERLELLGDSFLKYAISCNLFLVHEEADEGFLSIQRTKKVCNATLFTLGKNIGLIGYIHDSIFDPKHWVAACYPSKVACDINKLEDLHGKSSKDIEEGHHFVVCNKRHRWMQRKTVADAVEALIGAYLEDGGENAALAFMKFVGMDVVVDTLQIARVQSLSKINLSLLKNIDIEAIESLLSYSFRYKGLLIEAFTHASFSNHLGKCYQRLEFLGDSVLDFLITQHLYREFKNSKPGELTDLRSTIVSNESFARIVVERELYSHLIENSVELSRCIKEFITLQYGRAGDWEGDKCPKPILQPPPSAVPQLAVSNDKEASISRTPPSGASTLPDVSLSDKGKTKTVDSSKPSNKGKLECTSDIKKKGRIVETEEGSPWVLGDILESLSGAILVDGGFKLSVVWQVFESILQPLISAHRIKFHPVRELLELCQHKHVACKENLDKCDKQIGFTFEVHLDNHVVEGSAISKDKKSAKRQAALVALAKLKGLGYVHPSRSNMECTLSKKLLVQDDRSDAFECIDTSEATEPERNGIYEGSNQDSFWSYEDTANVSPSQDALNAQFSTVVLSGGEGPLWGQCPGLEYLKDGNVGDYIEQSPRLSPAHSFKMPWLDEGHDPCSEVEFNSPDVCPSTTVASLISPTEALSRGRPRADLYEACARKKWERPSFTCSNEEGPPHDKCFTYQVVLQLPHVGQVHCTGDSRRTAKAAMDSAAEELLFWLNASGYL